MKTSLIALAVTAVVATMPMASFADVSYNVSAVSDYRYRGISQSRVRPAVQGGVDVSAGAFYLGAWGSSIQWIKDFSGNASAEIDLYGGYKRELSKGLNIDVGVLAYVYPSHRLTPSPNTTEIYAAVTFGSVTAKYSHAVTNTFGNADSKNSGYVDVSASFDVHDGWTLAPHVGHQRISGPFSGQASYTDYSLSLSKDFNGLVPSIMLVGTDADKAFYSSPVNGKKLGKASAVVSVKYNF